MAERSARSTFPELEGFRVAALRGFRRVFAHAAPIFFERGIAIEATKASVPIMLCQYKMYSVLMFVYASFVWLHFTFPVCSVLVV